MAESTLQAVDVAMRGGGYYSAVTKGAKDAIDSATPHAGNASAMRSTTRRFRSIPSHRLNSWSMSRASRVWTGTRSVSRAMTKVCRPGNGLIDAGGVLVDPWPVSNGR